MWALLTCHFPKQREAATGPSLCQANTLHETCCFGVCSSSEGKVKGWHWGIQSSSHKASSPSAHSQGQDRVSLAQRSKSWPRPAWTPRYSKFLEWSELPHRPYCSLWAKFKTSREWDTKQTVQMILSPSCPLPQIHTHTGAFQWQKLGGLYSPVLRLLLSSWTNLSNSLQSLEPVSLSIQEKRIVEKIKLDASIFATCLPRNSNTVLLSFPLPFSYFRNKGMLVKEFNWLKDNINFCQNEPSDFLENSADAPVRFRSPGSYVICYVRVILFPQCALWDYDVQAKVKRKLCKHNPRKLAYKARPSSRSKPAGC